MTIAAVQPFTAGPAIEVEEPASQLRSGRRRCSGIDLEVAAGEVHALLGPNGAGKTTLMRILSGLVDPSAGSAHVLDRRAGRSPELRALIGMVPPGDRTFYLRLSGLENLVFFARLHGLRRRAARARSLELLEAVGLGDAATRPISTYSHGMQKRLSFARALLSDPELLLVDEATHDLDPVAAQQVRDLTAARAATGTAVLWATQRIEELHGFAQRVTVLDRGARGLRRLGGRADRHGRRRPPRARARPGHHAPARRARRGARRRSGSSSPPRTAATCCSCWRPASRSAPRSRSSPRRAPRSSSCRDERPPIERAFLAVTEERAA